MTVQEIIDQLNKVEDKTLPCHGIHGASEVSYEISTYGSVVEKKEYHNAGPLSDLEDGTKFVEFSLD